MGSIRDAILEEMLKRKLTIYQLSNILRGKVPQRTVYAFLTGEKDTGTETASIIMEALGLSFKPNSDKQAYYERTEVMDTKDYKLSIFVNDDKGYLNWLSNHPSGYVINTHREPSSDYLILHHANCGSINTDRRTNWTTTGYIKVCSDNQDELKRWALNEIGGALSPCGLCKP